MGGSGGPLGGLGGSAEPKNEIIVLRPILVLECIVLGHNNLLHYDFGVLGQNWALRAKKRPFWAKIGFAENWIFLKNIGSNFYENARKVLFWVNNELRKKWARFFIENFSGCQKWNFWSRAPFGPFLSPGDSPVGPKLFYTVYLGGTHPYHILGPLNRPLRHSRAPKGPVLAPKGPFGGPIGTRRAPGDQIWSQLLPIGLTGLESWSPDTLTWYLASSGPPGAPKGRVLAPKGPVLAPKGPK